MSRLLVDLGNSRLKWAFLEGGILSPSGVVLHRDRDMSRVLEEAWAELESPDVVHGASVVPESRRQALEAWVEARWACPVNWAVSQAEQHGLRNAYDRPERLGVDRWLALQGAWQRSREPACVVDCGSAVTVDILDVSGQHLGGWIAPGLQMMRAALQLGTDLDLAEGVSDGGLGRDTDAAILNGTLQAAAGLVEQGMYLAPDSARLLLTGGDAAVLARQLRRPYEICPDLVLEGLAGVFKGA